MHEDRFQFNRGAIRPLQCMADGWRLIKDEYWFFLGVAFVGNLVAGLAPLGILMGPAMCGIHICLLRQSNGQRVSFDMLFQGFNYFGPSLVATMCLMVPVLLASVLYLVAYFGGVMTLFTMEDQRRQAGQPQDPSFLIYLLSWVIGTTVVFVFFSSLAQMFFFFTYPLIVDRELSGMEAVRVSFWAVLGNFGGVLAIIFLEFLLVFFGLLLCYVGAIFMLPITFAMTAVAYRQVFPALDPYAGMPLDPEPPAPRLSEPSTYVQTGEPRSSQMQEKPPESSSNASP